VSYIHNRKFCFSQNLADKRCLDF